MNAGFVPDTDDKTLQPFRSEGTSRPPARELCAA